MIEDRTLDRDYSIDLIKISACIAVIGLHTFQKDLSVLNSTLYYLCGFAIPAFWMSSGAILMNRGKMNWRYSFSKILKVLRVVIIWNLLVICGLLVAKFIFTIDYSFSLLTIPKEIIKSLLQKGVLWHFWYFGALMILYLLLPILYKINDLGRWILLSIIGLICLTFQIYSSVVGYPIQKYVIQTFRLWTWLFYFIGGGELYGLIKKGSLGDLNQFTIIAKFFFVVTIIVLIYYNFIGRYVITEPIGILHAEYFYDSLLTMLWMCVLFIFIYKIRLNNKHKNIIAKLSPLTMGIYIVHPLIIKVYRHFIGITTIGDSLLFFVSILTCSIIIVACMNLLPIIKYLIKL